MTEELRDAARIHFVGIGGAGMSAIAKVLIEQGRAVSGSDLKRSRAASVLEAMGARIQIGHDPSLIAQLRPDVVVASSAIPEGNPELQAARAAGTAIVGRGAALAAILAGKRSIVVAGTHGKTTTTSMVVTILLAAGVDPTYLIGGGLNDVGTNARAGRSDIAVAESDESDASFLLLAPQIAVVTNVEADHLDHWGSLGRIREAFGKFIANVALDGSVVVPATDDELIANARRLRRTVTFDGGGDVRAREISVSGTRARFVIEHAGERQAVNLSVPGRHNVSNALAAAASCLEVGLDLGAVARGLARFRGVERRFQVRGEINGVTVIDDYAHHPTEVQATLDAARPGPWRRVIAVFQPHRYSRTAALWRDFGPSFDAADRVVLTEVYGAGEQPVPGITGKLIADAVCARLPGRPVAYLPHRAELVEYLLSLARPGDAVLTLGAGDITALGDEVLDRLAPP